MTRLTRPGFSSQGRHVLRINICVNWWYYCRRGAERRAEDLWSDGLPPAPLDLMPGCGSPGDAGRAVVTALASMLGAAVPVTAQETGADRAAAQPFKHIPLGRQGQVWVGFGAQLRARVESWRNFGFDAALDHDDDFVLYRVLLNADLHLGKRLRSFVEAKSAVLTDRNLPGGRRPADADDIDLQNAYLELSLAPAAALGITVRAGRQELLFGKQRLVSPLDWANTRRTFDGARGTATIRDWTLDGFFVRPVRVVKSGFNRWDRDTDFFGLHTARKPGRAPGLEAYWLMLRRETAAFNGTAGPESRHTFGARLAGTVGGGRAEYDFEAAYQRGRLGAGTISAAMFGGELAYTVAQGWAPDFTPASTRAATDRRAAVGRSTSYSPRARLPGLHRRGWPANMAALNAGVGIKLVEAPGRRDRTTSGARAPTTGSTTPSAGWSVRPA